LKFAISYSTASLGVDPDHLLAYARHAEACGFEALYLPEHVVLHRGESSHIEIIYRDLPSILREQLERVAAQRRTP